MESLVFYFYNSQNTLTAINCYGTRPDNHNCVISDTSTL